MKGLDYFSSLLLNNKIGEYVLLDGTHYLTCEGQTHILGTPALFNKIPNAKDTMDNLNDMDEIKYKVLKKRSKSGFVKGELLLLRQGEGYYVLALSIPYKKPKKGDVNGVVVLKCGNSINEMEASIKSAA